MILILENCQKALDLESERALNYLYGHQIEKLSQISQVEVAHRGFLLRSAAFLRFVFNSTSADLTHYEIGTRSDFLYFAGTQNQLKSLLPVIESHATERSPSNLVILPKIKGVSQRPAIVFSLSLRLFFVTIILFISKSVSLYRKLKNINYTLAHKFFNKFAEAYLYLPYFLDTLEKSRPSFVVMSNDHNTPNRCLRLAAHYLKIKTVYLQHASVSDLFPPLDFNISFLDGMISAKTYAQCEKNLEGKKQEERIIFLSGMSKILRPSRRVSSKKIGLAVNTLDQFEKLEELAKTFCQKGFNLHIRVHPAQERNFILRLENFVKTDPEKLSLSSPSSESLGDFFAQCSLLISGNSSIHLEAALVDVMTYYYEFSDRVEHPDYYGYVKNGISLNLPDISLVDASDVKKLESVPLEREQSVKLYAESFKTPWQGREGDLIAKTLSELKENKISEEIWQAADDIEGFAGVKIYRLKGLR